MRRAIIFIPTDTYMNLMSVLYGITLSAKNTGIHLCIFTPIALIPHQTIQKVPTNDTRKDPPHRVAEDSTIPAHRVKDLLKSGHMDILMEEIISNYSNKTNEDAIVLVEGLKTSDANPWAVRLNYEIANTLNAEIVVVTTVGDESLSQIQEQIELIYASLPEYTNIAGVIVNRRNDLFRTTPHLYPKIFNIFQHSKNQSLSSIDVQEFITASKFPILGYVPWQVELTAPFSIDVFRYLDATAIHYGESRRITSVMFCAHDITTMLEHLQVGSLLVISSERLDLLLAACLATIGDIEISGILLIGRSSIPLTIWNLCTKAFQTGVPIFQVITDTLQTAQNLQTFILENAIDNMQNNHNAHAHIAHNISTTWITSLSQSTKKRQSFSPAAFKHQLTKLSRQVCKRIILPEGDEPRIIQAASIAAERGMATCILLGNETNIKNIALELNVTLGAHIQILDPVDIRGHYVRRLVELRQKQGMNTCMAKTQLEENIVLGTMMLEKGEVDGLVSGVRSTTANTIRPALQLIKTASHTSLVSSVFFMLLPQQVLVYGDCAINPNPNAQELAEIAIQSAHSALAFGIEPRIAMISYSTGHSGSGKDVEKIREATYIVKNKRPDLLIDGPLQYDAAIMMDVAKSKAPCSPVAGQATVFIFPDLNTGNTTYKAVQRAANINSIGPMLQGMRKPVNDLSRGALVNDIVYTIALTAIQALQSE
ncbi:phosphate acetyltransferase [Candidatus Erwinia haradaeae]|uniref:Phosphate acetyltransferase n=1 Tax=Candidatus Erwinia haradaeae TaxID=1922217 RepID=A0A451D9F4_9GAMM|nr:phosphate acetyltransferase [Candidatus Erwinia haradaeae]VFP82874.1 Phosphate acetyltransferase [Candidatus Erwinia haradaeae]